MNGMKYFLFFIATTLLRPSQLHHQRQRALLGHVQRLRVQLPVRGETP